MTERRASIEDEIARLQRENEMLRSFVATSKDALWCIEFDEPVDLTAPESEVIRQVFENESHWRLCNEAMARLYKLPADLDFNSQNVRFVFPRNAENEEFVRNLIAGGFNVDGVPSLDQTYENEWIAAENDVRSRVENGLLHRMWGAVRNLSQQKRREQALSERLDSLVKVLSAIPDPVLVVDGDGKLQAANPALEWALGWQLDDVLGRVLTDLIHLPSGLSSLDPAPGPGDPPMTLAVTVETSAGLQRSAEAHVAAFYSHGVDRSIVITLDGIVAGAAARAR
jgi:PAS domain S-box-containing protein